MDFELKKLSLAQAAQTPAALLIVLVAQGNQPPKDTSNGLASLWSAAAKAGDFDGSAGQSLPAYGVTGVKAARVNLVGVGEGKPKDVAKALSAAVSGFKPTAKSGAAVALIVWAQEPNGPALEAAMHAAEAACYSYGATKSKPEIGRAHV